MRDYFNDWYFNELRHAPYLIAQLAQMDGNLSKYVDSMTKGASVQDDYTKGLKSFSNQFRLFQNNMGSLNSLVSGFADTIGVDMLTVINHLIEGLRDLTEGTEWYNLALSSTAESVIGVGVAVTGLITTLFTLKKITKALQGFSLFGFSAPQMALIAGAVIAIGAMYSFAKKKNAEKQLEIELDEKLYKNIQMQIQANETLIDVMTAQAKILKDMANEDYTKSWDKAYDIISAVADKSSQLNKILEATSKISTFKLPELKSVNDIYEEATEKIAEQKKQLESNAEVEDKIFKKKTQKYKQEKRNAENWLKYGDQDIQNARQFEKQWKQFAENYDYSTETEAELERVQSLFIDHKRRMEGLQVLGITVRGAGSENEQAVINSIKINNDNIYEEKQKLIDRLISSDEEYARVYYQHQFATRSLDKDSKNKMLMNSRKYFKDQFNQRSKSDASIRSSFKEQVNYAVKNTDEMLNELEGKTLSEALLKLDISDIESFRSVLDSTLQEQYALEDLIKIKLEIESENVTKINQELSQMLGYYQQIATVSSEIEYEMFSDVVKKMDISEVKSLKGIANNLGFTEVGKGIGDLIGRGFSESDLVGMIKDNTLLDTLGFYKSMDESLKNLKETKISQEALDKFKVDNSSEWAEIASNYEDSMSDLQKYTDYMEKKLIDLEELKKKALTFVDPSTMKAMEYYDNELRLKLELEKVNLSGIELLQKENELLRLNNELSEKTTTEKINAYKESLPLQKDLFDMSKEDLLTEKERLETIKKNQIAREKASIDAVLSGSDKKASIQDDEEIKRFDIERYKAIADLLEIINKKQSDKADYEISSVENIKKQDKLISNIVKDIDKISEGYDKILKKNKSYSELTGLIGKETKQGILIQASMAQIELNKNSNIIDSLKNKKNLNDIEKDILTNAEKNKSIEEERLNDYEQLLKWIKEYEVMQKKITSNLNKASDIREDTKDLSRSEYEVAVEKLDVLDREYADLKKKEIFGKDEITRSQATLDIAQNRYDKEVAITNEISKRNDLVMQSISGAGQIVDLLSGADSAFAQSFSLLENASIFMKDPKTKRNKFQDISTGFSAMKSAGKMDLENFGMMMGGAGAVASGASAVFGVIKGIEDKKEAKELAKFKKEYDLSVKQLEALQSMSNTFKSYSQKIVDELSKLPTGTAYKEQMEKSQSTIEEMRSEEFELSGMTGTRKGAKKYFGLGERKTKHISKTSQEIVSAFGFGDMDKMSLDEMKQLQSQMVEISNWNKWYQDKFDVTRVKTTNMEEIESQLGAYIDTYQEADRILNDLMKEATLTAFKSASYVNLDEKEAEFREIGTKMFTKIIDGIEVTDTGRVDKFVEKQMKGIPKISTETGINMRNSLLDGLSSGVKPAENIANSFKEIFGDLSYDINSILTDVEFGHLYKDIEKLTIKASEDLVNLKKEFQMFEDTPAFGDQDRKARITTMLDNEYIPNLVEAIKKTQELEDNTYDLNELLRTELLKEEGIDKDIINKMFPVDELEKSISGAFMSALKTDNYSDAISSLGTFFGDTLIDNMLEEMLSDKFNSQIMNLSSKMSDVMAEGFSIGAFQSIRSEFTNSMIEMEQAQTQVAVLKDMFTFGMGDVEYEEVNKDIRYETGSTKTINNYYNSNYAISLGNLIATDPSMDAFALRFKEHLDQVTR